MIRYKNLLVNKESKRQLVKAFNNFLRLFLGSKDKKINIIREIDKKIICLNISSIEYSVPINE